MPATCACARPWSRSRSRSRATPASATRASCSPTPRTASCSSSTTTTSTSATSCATTCRPRSPTRRRCSRTYGATARRSGRTTTSPTPCRSASDAFDNRLVVVGEDGPPRGPAVPQQARRLSLRGRARMTGVHRSELTPVAFLQRAAYLHPARVAVAHEDGRRITYGELEERCHRLANALRARGLAPRRPRRGALAQRAGHPRGALRGAARRRRPRRHQHAPGAGRDRPHPAPLGRAHAARRPRARAAASSRSTERRSTSCASTTAVARTIPTSS